MHGAGIGGRYIDCCTMLRKIRLRFTYIGYTDKTVSITNINYNNKPLENKRNEKDRITTHWSNTHYFC